MQKRDVLIYLSYLTGGDWDKMYEYIRTKDYDTDIKEVWDQVNKNKAKTLTILDEDYPEYLRSVSHPPLVLFYYGDISLIKDYKKNISIIGKRRNSAYGRKATEYYAGRLSVDYPIVSGLARGIDAIAHETTLNKDGRTIAVLGSGIELCYPPDNLDLYLRIKNDPNSLLISEYPNNTMPDPSHFPERNRLIAAFSRLIIVTEADLHSGTSITVSFGLNLQRDICCVPGNIFTYPDSLCHRLINMGATLASDINDVYCLVGHELDFSLNI